LKGGGPMSIVSILGLCSNRQGFPVYNRYGNLHFLSGAPF